MENIVSPLYSGHDELAPHIVYPARAELWPCIADEILPPVASKKPKNHGVNKMGPSPFNIEMDPRLGFLKHTSTQEA